VLDIRRGESRLTAKDSKIKIASGSYIDVPLPSYRMPDVKSTAGYFAKDGMDPIDLFIGQEGTLSVIANIEMALVKKPAGIFSCFVFFRDTQDAWAFSDDLKKVAGVLSIEYFDDNALDILRSRSLDVPERSKAAVFFEIESAERGADAADKCMELIAEHNARADDTWVAMDEKRAEEFTGYRHSIPEGINEIVKRSRFQKLSADIAVPHERFKEMMNYYISSFRRTALRHIIFGHIGESHVHVNILPGSEVELKAGRDLLYDFARKGVAIGGTVSAEHGIGKIKHKFLELMYGRKGIMEMARIKKAFDPNCILGLDNIFPRELLKSV
jgi:D-lactate dehydrogenase (cytochrome)